VTVHTVAHYVVVCNRCRAEHLVGPVGSVLAARIEAGKDGWQFQATLVRDDGTKLRVNRDLCPNETGDEAAT
jgi:cytochrome oxidase assembly protein ShyY1